MVGQTISHYQILEKLGAGGMGVVFKAQDLKLNRFVALKFIPTVFEARDEEKQRFIIEARAASSLDHPNIGTIYEIDETVDGQLFIAMAYYDGETLKKKVSSHQLSVNSVIDIAMQIAQGLAKAHEHGIIHRDIKPANMIITKEGTVKIVDFGLAKFIGEARVTKTASTLGTTAYMSPEQARGEQVDGRADIWSLGVVTYEILTGRLPFKGEYDAAVIYAIVNEPLQPLSSLRSDLPDELEAIINKCLEKDTADRYQRAADLIIDLRRLKRDSDPKGIPAKEKSQNWPQRAFFSLRWKNPLRNGLIVLALAIAAGLYHALTPKTESLDKKSIAVLPFTNLSDSKEDEYFSDGITEDIITRLSKIRDLKVISRTSAMHYKNSDKSLPEIGKELKIATVLQGSVRRAGNRVRITSQLIDARNDEHLWAETYDRDLQDIFEIQSEVAQQIAMSLEARLIPAERAQVAQKSTENLQAYSLYLKGRYFWNKRTPDNVLKGLQFFERAIAEDSSYALAYAGIADAYNALGSIEYGVLSPHETVPKAEAAAQKALQLDPALVEAHVALANIKFNYEWNWPAAERLYKRVIELNPGYAAAHHGYSHLLCATGRLDAALAEDRRALELDPLSLIINTQVGMCLYYLRRYDQAIEQHRKTLELDPAFLQARLALGMAYERSGNDGAAIAEFEKALTLAPGLPIAEALLAYAYAVDGKTAEALKLLAGFEHPGKRKFVSPFHMMVVHLGLGNEDQVFTWLEKAREEHSSYLVYFKVEPLLDGLRTDPRFTALLRQMGLEE